MASIRERNGSYQITVSCGYDINGKKILETTTFTPDPCLTPNSDSFRCPRAGRILSFNSSAYFVAVPGCRFILAYSSIQRSEKSFRVIFRPSIAKPFFTRLSNCWAYSFTAFSRFLGVRHGSGVKVHHYENPQCPFLHAENGDRMGDH